MGRGYPVDITDNLGTKYSLMKVTSRLDQEFIENSKDGKLELCVFVPSQKLSRWEQRTIRITSRLRANRRLDRYLSGFWTNQSRMVTSTLRYDDNSEPVTVVTVVQEHLVRPTVNVVPSYASLLEPSRFDSNDPFEAEKALARADFYRGQSDIDAEKRWLKEALKLAPESEGATLRLKELEPGAQP